MVESKLKHIYGFEKLAVWQEIRYFVTEVYQMTKSFPQEEKYGLSDQLRRAAVSVSSNIAEGSTRTSSKDQSHFYQISYSSLMEVLSQVTLALDLDYITEAESDNLRAQIEKLSYQINQLHKSALSRPSKPSQLSKPSKPSPPPQPSQLPKA